MGKYLQGSGVSLVLDFADAGSSSHECFIMVLVVLRIRQSIVFISGRGTYVGTKKSITIEGLIKYVLIRLCCRVWWLKKERISDISNRGYLSMVSREESPPCMPRPPPGIETVHNH